jgi:hypothetical protein
LVGCGELGGVDCGELAGGCELGAVLGALAGWPAADAAGVGVLLAPAGELAGAALFAAEGGLGLGAGAPLGSELFEPPLGGLAGPSGAGGFVDPPLPMEGVAEPEQAASPCNMTTAEMTERRVDRMEGPPLLSAGTPRGVPSGPTRLRARFVLREMTA